MHDVIVRHEERMLQLIVEQLRYSLCLHPGKNDVTQATERLRQEFHAFLDETEDIVSQNERHFCPNDLAHRYAMLRLGRDYDFWFPFNSPPDGMEYVDVFVQTRQKKITSRNCKHFVVIVRKERSPDVRKIKRKLR